MDFKPDWRQKHALLKEYISSNPEISIDSCETTIPQPLRDRFYLLFNDCRKAVVNAWGGNPGVDANALSERYLQTERELLALLKIKNIELPLDLSLFLHNPSEGLVRWIYDLLFDLLKGRISADEFEPKAFNELTSKSMEMFRLGYEAWAALSLIHALDPDEIFGVSIDEESNLYLSELSDIALGRQSHNPSKRIPEIILHSKRLDSYIAFKMPLVSEVDLYYMPFEAPTKKLLRDRTGDTSLVLGHRMIFLSRFKDLKKIPVFADLIKREIYGPDLTIEFLMANDLIDPDACFKVETRMDIMKPERGGVVAIMNHETFCCTDTPDVKFSAYTIGLAPSGLVPIIDKLR